MTGRDDQCREWVQGAVARYEGPLVRYAARLLGNVEAARDVVQETFLRLCREEPEKLNGRLAEWLYTVCRRRALDVCEKESRMKTLLDEDAEPISSADDDPSAVAVAADTTAGVLAVVAGLPDRQQEVVRLRFQDGLSYREISTVTGLSVTNVGYLLHAAIKTIRQRMAQE